MVRDDESAVVAARELRVVIGRLRRRLRELSTVDDLTPSQTSVLSRITQDGPSTASTLAVLERVRPQSIAAVIAALEGRGLVERHPDPDDGRRQLVFPTKAATEWVGADRRAREEWLAEALTTRFTAEERRTLIAALGLLDRLTH
jgi:DNA-binding MarR family transcriptional regulator